MRHNTDVTFTNKSLEDYNYWALNDKKVFKQIAKLIEECRRTPYEGSGKPEALKHELSGKWSRRINREHRLIYEVIDNFIVVISCRYHYK